MLVSMQTVQYQAACTLQFVQIVRYLWEAYQMKTSC
jgi:hypothetical protein